MPNLHHPSTLRRLPSVAKEAMPVAGEGWVLGAIRGETKDMGGPGSGTQ